MKSKESSMSEGKLKMNGISRWRPALRLGKTERELSNYLATGAPAVAGPLAHPSALGLARSKGITVAYPSLLVAVAWSQTHYLAMADPELLILLPLPARQVLGLTV